MIIISLRFSGGSTGEAHDIAHIASSIVARASGLFFARHSVSLNPVSLRYAVSPPDERYRLFERPTANRVGYSD